MAARVLLVDVVYVRLSHLKNKMCLIILLL